MWYPQGSTEHHVCLPVSSAKKVQTLTLDNVTSAHVKPGRSSLGSLGGLLRAQTAWIGVSAFLSIAVLVSGGSFGLVSNCNLV